MRSCLFALLFLHLAGAASAFAKGDPETLLRNMKPTWKKVSDISVELHQKELIDGKTVERAVYFKFAKPFRVYIKYIEGDAKGREVIYQGKSWNKGKALVALKRFPFLTLSVNPFSKRALTGRHHPISHIDLGYLVKNVISQLDTAKKNSDLGLSSLGADTIDGRACTRVEMTLNPKEGKTVNPKKGDSWFSLARSLKVDYFVLQHQNPGKNPADPSASIWVPTYYGSKMETCVDDATGLPLHLKVWDHAGDLYEDYTFKKLKVNPGLGEIDFDPENAEYDF